MRRSGKARQTARLQRLGKASTGRIRPDARQRKRIACELVRIMNSLKDAMQTVSGIYEEVRPDGRYYQSASPPGSLPDIISQVMAKAKTPLTLPQIVKLAQAAGWRTSSPNKALMVNAAIRRKRLARRIRKGLYTAK